MKDSEILKKKKLQNYLEGGWGDIRKNHFFCT